MLPTAASVNKLPHDQAFCTLHRLSPLFNRAAQLASPGVYLRVQGLQAKCSHARTSSCLKYNRSCVHLVAAMSAAHAHVEPSTQSVEVAIITTVGCQFCKRAKETLKQAGLEFREIEASNQPELLNKIKETTGRRTVPQVFVGGSCIGGSDDLSQLITNNQLSELLHEAQGKPALPKDLQDAIDTASKPNQASTDAAFIPPGISRQEYTRSQELAASMELSHHDIRWVNPDLRTFNAAEALRWLMQHKGIQQREAKQTLALLQQTHQISVVDKDLDLSNELSEADLSTTHLQLVSAAPVPQFGQTLNKHYTWFGLARSPSEVSESLRQIILRLYDKHLASDGKALNYKALKQDPVFKTYVNATAELQKVDVVSLNREERMAFFINIYNAVVVHALAVFGPASNLKQRLSFFNAIKYNIGGQDYSANDMEHGVLRGNRPTPASPWVLLGVPQWSSGYFKPSDPRAAHVVSPVDPRIHFALVCGAKSCPPIKVYTPTSLQEGLYSATMAFCEGEVIIHKEERVAEVSKIFKWYKQDFGPQEHLFPWLVQYLSGSSKADLQELLDTVGAKGIHVKYRHYDWALNSQE